MPTILVKVMLFISSYFPLSAIYFFLLRGTHPNIGLSLLLIGYAGLIALVLFIRVKRTSNPIAMHIATVGKKDGESMSYIVTYLLPFLTTDYSSIDNVISLAILFFTIAILYIHSDMIHINPMINFLGYHIYDIELSTGSTVSVIARDPLRKGTAFNGVCIGDHIYLEVKG